MRVSAGQLSPAEPGTAEAVKGGTTADVSQSEGLARWVAEARAAARSNGRRRRLERVVAITGGKGGVGKSNLSLSFSLALAEKGRRVLLADCDSGLGNIDVLLGICPQRHLGHVLAGECDLPEALVDGPAGVSILPAASGLDALGKATAAEANRLLSALAGVESDYDMVILDTSAGLGPQVRALLKAVPEVLVVTTPEPTAMADAYATLKVLHSQSGSTRVCLVINMADSVREAEDAAEGVARVADRYLGWRPEYLGLVPRDPAVPMAVRHQRPFFQWSPAGPAARALRQVAASWLREPQVEQAPRPSGLASILRVLWKAGT